MNNDQKKVKRSIIDNRGFWMVLSLLSAMLLWVYVTTTEGVEIEEEIVGVPIEFVGADALRESSGLIVTEQDQTTVNLTLRATRRVLWQLSNTNVTATINLNRVTNDGRYSVSFDIAYPAGINPDDVTVVRRSVNIVNFYVDKQARKTVPVEGEFTGNTAEGYMAETDLIFDPMAVTVTGPKTAVDKVDHAYIAISRTEVDKTLQFSTAYDLRDASNEIIDDVSITREVEEVFVTLNVLSTKRVPLDVTIINAVGATREDNTDIRIEPDTIMLSGDAATIDSTTKINLGTIDLSAFASEYTNTFTIVPPNDTENLTGITEATVTVNIVGLAYKTFEILPENISCINVPDGYTAENITQALPVVIRASESVLSQIQVNNLYAVADLSDLSGTNASGVVQPTVRISINGFPDAGVIKVDGKEYTIFVTLKED